MERNTISTCEDRPTAGSAVRATWTERPIRLTIDARRLGRRGMATYTRNLLAAIRRTDRGIRVTAIVPSERISAAAGLCDETRTVDAPIYTLREQLEIPAAARGCDLLHVPHYNVPLLYKGPLVVTIHDLTHITEPSYRNTVKAWVYARPMLHAAAARASHILTVSRYSKEQIAERLGVAEEKISVVYNSVAAEFAPTDRREAEACVRESLGIDRPYLLFVGSLKPHKNLRTLIRAFARIRSRGQADFVLLLAGDDRRHGKPLLDECERMGLGSSVRNIPWVPAELLPKVYAAADLVVMPSTNEGFGLPVLEAMACGAPVVSSTAASMPEVGGDAAVYFDPHNVEELATAIERVIDSPSLQAELRGKGLKQAAKFTWEESARKHIEAYRKVLALL